MFTVSVCCLFFSSLIYWCSLCWICMDLFFMLDLYGFVGSFNALYSCLRIARGAFIVFINASSCAPSISCLLFAFWIYRCIFVLFLFFNYPLAFLSCPFVFILRLSCCHPLSHRTLLSSLWKHIHLAPSDQKTQLNVISCRKKYRHIQMLNVFSYARCLPLLKPAPRPLARLETSPQSPEISGHPWWIPSCFCPALVSTLGRETWPTMSKKKTPPAFNIKKKQKSPSFQPRALSTNCFAPEDPQCPSPASAPLSPGAASPHLPLGPHEQAWLVST